MVESAGFLITQAMSSVHTIYAIKAIARIPVPVTEADVKLASEAFDQGMSLFERVVILRAVVGVAT